MKNVLILIISSVIFLAGCREPAGEGDYSIKLSTNNISLEKDASTGTITAKKGWQGISKVVFDGKLIRLHISYMTPDGKYVDTNGKYIDGSGNIIDDPSIVIEENRDKITCEWFEIEEISNKEASISVADNDTGEEREIKITFFSAHITESVIVTQAAE